MEVMKTTSTEDCRRLGTKDQPGQPSKTPSSREKTGWRQSLMLEYLSSICQTRGSISNSGKKKGGGKERIA